MRCTVTLVNANEMLPVIGPIGLDYLAASLEAQGCEVRLLDLTWAEDAAAAMASHFRGQEDALVGFTLRNVDDCYLASRYSCLPHAKRIISLLRNHIAAPIVLGGCGFSSIPAPLLLELEADYGIAGDGEEALPQLALALSKGETALSVPGLLWRTDGKVAFNPPAPVDMNSLPLEQRSFIDNARYWREGGQGGFESKRGCDRRCIYCSDPVAKGCQIRLRDPRKVAQEVANLAAQGVVHLHTCDPEFSHPHNHALAVCDAFIERRLKERVQWWAYCAPAEFDADLAEKMKRAGCAGINFGVDNGCDEQLARLGRDHRVADLERVARLCHDLDIVFLFDLLLGAPGETAETLRQTIDLMKKLDPSRVGISAGVRVHPGTPLAAQVIHGPLSEQPGLIGALEDNEGLTEPVFYVAPEVGPDISACVVDLVAGDQRFFCPDLNLQEADYNYRENRLLVEAVRNGHRGAYWDIMRRLQEGLPPA